MFSKKENVLSLMWLMFNEFFFFIVKIIFKNLRRTIVYLLLECSYDVMYERPEQINILQINFHL